MDTMTPDDSVDPVALLARAGVLAEAASEWMAAEPTRTADLATDRARYAAFWERSAALLAELPTKRRRSDAEAAAAALVLGHETVGRQVEVPVPRQVLPQPVVVIAADERHAGAGVS